MLLELSRRSRMARVSRSWLLKSAALARTAGGSTRVLGRFQEMRGGNGMGAHAKLQTDSALN